MAFSPVPGCPLSVPPPPPDAGHTGPTAYASPTGAPRRQAERRSIRSGQAPQDGGGEDCISLYWLEPEGKSEHSQRSVMRKVSLQYTAGFVVAG
jgi:hypothetical protein